MKNINVLKVVVVVAVIVYCVMCLTACALLTYNKEAVVVDNADGVVTCEDEAGELWCYEGEASIGESVVLTMYSKGTHTIYDDEIVSVK